MPNNFAMLESVRQKIQRLIAAYETERMKREKLQAELEKLVEENEAYKRQITELEKQIDTLKLAEVFKADGEKSPEAKRKINQLIKEIDRCISLMEG